MKQVIVIRKDLNMRKGKMVAQGAHASLAVTLKNLHNPYVEEWLSNSFTKIVVSVDSEDELNSVISKADAMGVINVIIMDNGQTEFHGTPTVTAAAIGPGPNELINSVTGDLKLL